jgi:hypothetical protein
LFDSTDTTFKIVANSGDITNSSGYDIIFTSDAGGSTLLDWEIELYDGTGGRFVAWVKIPTLSHTADTVIYVFYGNAAITTFQGNVNGTWDSSFLLVNHYGDGSTLSLTDSTSNGRNGTNSVIPIMARAGQISGAGTPHYTGLGHQAYVTYNDSGLPSSNGSRTFSLWINFEGVSLPSGYCFSTGTWLTNHEGFSLAPGRVPGILYDGGTAYSFSYSFSNAVWYHIVITYDSASSTLSFYVDGALIASTTVSGLNTVNPGTMYTFETNPADYNANIDAALDEFRIANIAHSVDYILAEYNNQVNPSGFYTLGSPPPSGALLQIPMTGGMKDLTGGING